MDQLHSSSNPWRPLSSQGSQLAVNLEGKLRAVLNKVAPSEKLPRLLVTVVNLLCDCCAPSDSDLSNISEEFRLRRAAMAITESAIRSPLYGEAYAVVCDYIMNTASFSNFSFILKRCLHEEFVARMDRWPHLNSSSGDHEKKIAEKRHHMALVEFAAHLFKQGVLSYLELRDDWLTPIYVMIDTNNVALEIFINLLALAGPQLEAVLPTELHTYFSHLTDILNRREKPLRMLFLVQNLLELRARRWRNRHHTPVEQ